MKTDLGLSEEETAKAGPVMCYPIMQAEVPNREKTEPNIVMGLCVGHDSLFYKYSEALFHINFRQYSCTLLCLPPLYMPGVFLIFLLLVLLRYEDIFPLPGLRYTPSST